MPTDLLRPAAQLAEAAGFDGLAIGEHVVTPQTYSSPYPYTPDGAIWWDPASHFPDPWVTFGALSSITERLRFMTTISILPLHDTFALAKAVSTAAVLSGDRIALGLGSGWLREEFDALGRDFSTRGARVDEMLDVFSKLLSGDMVEHDGTFHQFPPVQMSPVPGLPVPIYVGGESPAALKRAARWDGWCAARPYDPEELELVLRNLAAARNATTPTTRPFATYVALMGSPSLDAYQQLEDAGVTGVFVIPAIQYPELDMTEDGVATGIERFRTDILDRRR